MSKMSMIDALEKLSELNEYTEILVKTNAGEPQLIEKAIEDIKRNAEDPDETFDLRVTENSIMEYDENGYFHNNEPLYKVVREED
jgi:hypothetical protein